MKRFLHFNIYKTVPKGVLNQIIDEKQSVEKLSRTSQWDIKIFSHDKNACSFHEEVNSPTKNIFVKDIANYILLRKRAYGWLSKVASNYNAVLLRYRAGDIFEYSYSKYFDRFFTVHHTMEVPEAKTRKFPSGALEAAIESYTGPKILSNAAGIIGMTPEIVRYELSRVPYPKPSFCHPNGIDLEHYLPVGDFRSKDDVPTFLLVASIQAPWHGIDLLLNMLSKSTEPYKLHIVGAITAGSAIKDDRIIFHGVNDSKYVSELASKCDIGLSSFALFRKNMREACPLKVRQYLAMGLPVYSGHIDSGLPVDFPYHKNGGLDIEELFAFARDSRNLDRGEVRAAASEYIDKKILMEKLINWLESNC